MAQSSAVQFQRDPARQPCRTPLVPDRAVLTGRGDGAGRDRSGPAGPHVDLPPKPACALHVSGRVLGPVPKVHPAAGVCTVSVAGVSSRLPARRTWHSSSSTSTPVHIPSRSGRCVRSMPGSNSSCSGGGRSWSSRSSTTRSDGPVATPTPKSRPRDQRWISSRSSVAARTPW